MGGEARYLLRRTTGDGEDLAVDPATVLGCEESDDTGDVLGESASAERAVVGHEGLDLLGGPLGSTTGTVAKC